MSEILVSSRCARLNSRNSHSRLEIEKKLLAMLCSVVLIQSDKAEKQGVEFVIVFAPTSKRSSLKYVIEHVLLPTCITKLFTPQISVGEMLTMRRVQICSISCWNWEIRYAGQILNICPD